MMLSRRTNRIFIFKSFCGNPVTPDICPSAVKLLVSMHITDGNKHPARYNCRGKDTDKWENHVIFFPSATSEKEIQFFVRLKYLTLFYIMSGNGSTFSEYVQGNALAKITPTATNSGPIQTSMQSKSVGGFKKQRRSGCSKKSRTTKRHSKKNRKSRSNRR